MVFACTVVLACDATFRDLTWQDVRAAILREFCAHRDRCERSGPSEDWMKRVHSFEEAAGNGRNTAVGDSVPLAAANAHGVELVVHRPSRDPTIVLPDAVVLPDPVNLHLVGDRCKPLVGEELADGSPSICANADQMVCPNPQSKPHWRPLNQYLHLSLSLRMSLLVVVPQCHPSSNRETHSFRRTQY